MTMTMTPTQSSAMQGQAGHAATVYRLEGIAELARKMRTAQKRYFKTRSHDALKESKALESQMDQSLQRYFGSDEIQSELFS